jgi:methionine aminotransferase
VNIQPKLPSGGVSIFAVMTRLANEHGAINLSQGFPDYSCAPELIDAVARYMREGTTSTRRCRACWRCARRWR